MNSACKGCAHGRTDSIPGRQAVYSCYAPPIQQERQPRQARRPDEGRWRVVLLRAKGEILGTVEAPDVASAKAAATVQFGLDEIQRGRNGGD